ncbi:tetratricopeptide (TPR) repeat protein [Flavobacterium arsenatis]|uniref:Tetratricopeptide (TPR) repeat protein n=1 Tax=Flavobacterium arsenatis TaxID=1484332 RepID=A0ABU1TLI3_9FLAO|nr:histidine kinase [Flavobacterium arsenatis]MDR6966723.1 tetratricopeptide (TPR) repeat protein [Flavobacterium arsenatis]
MYQNIKKVTLLVFFLIAFNASSQDKKLDSLKNILNTKVPDTTKLQVLANIVNSVESTSKEYTLYNDKFKEIAEKLLKQKNLDEASRLNAVSAIGQHYVQKGFQVQYNDYISAIKYLNMSLPYFEAKKHRIYKASVLISLGVLYNKIGSAEIATANNFKALRIFEEEKHPSGISYATQTIANLYNEQKKYKEALQYYLKTYDIYFKKDDLLLQDNIQKVLLFKNISKCYQELKDCKLSESYLLKALALAKEINDFDSISEVYYEMGQFEIVCNANYNQALEYLQNSYSASEKLEKQAKSQISIGKVYIKLKAFDKAESYLQKGLENGKKIKNLKFQKEATDYLVELYKVNKQYDKAFEMKELNTAIKDSIKADLNKEILLKKQLQYDYENKEKLNKLLQEKKIDALKLKAQQKEATQNNWLIALSGVLMMVLLGGYFYYRNSKQKQAISTLEKNQIKQKLLISQMNPHFIFNSVQNIRTLIKDHQNNEAVDYLDRFSRLTRQILENSNENYISLEEEVEMLENYLSIQQLLYDNKFSYTIDVQEGIDKESVFLPPMLAQPFIENGIKHGLSNTSENGKISVHFYLKNDKLFFEVTDNGKGFDTDKKVSQHKSLAMNITKERLVTYTKNKDFEVQTENLINTDGAIAGAKVVFEIPYIYEN